MAQQYCSKCRKTMADTNFYTYKNQEKCELCKGCLTMHINNWEPDTYLWLLEKFDVPYIEAEWNTLRDRAYQKDPYKMNGMSVFGKYLSKMKLKQWKEFTWADTERLKLEAEEKAKLYGKGPDLAAEELERIKTQFENGEINEAEYKTYTEVLAPEPMPQFLSEPPRMAPPSAGDLGSPYPENSPFEQIDVIDVGADLTQEDKVYLAMKWGRLYKADEWVALEQLYTEFMDSFDIQGAARIDTLKMICKTSLKMNQAIDCGDIDTYQKLSRVYDSMMKSAKFTEAQNKEEKADFIDSVGELVAFCEKEGGFIERYCTDQPKDIVDLTLNDMKKYTETLIKQDSGLAQQIEQYLKKKEIAEEMKQAEQEKENDEAYREDEDDDYVELFEAIERDREADELLYDEEDE